MAIKFIFFLNLLIITINASSPNPPEVHEEVKEDDKLPENIRIPRHPKLQILPVSPPYFDFTKSAQQDPQRLRYAQQQAQDSYVRAFHQERDTRRPLKHRKAEKVPITPEQFEKTTYDTRPKSENRQTPKPSNQKKVDAILPEEHERITPKSGYQVHEQIDQDVEPSRKHESRIYFGKEEVVKTVQDYLTPLSPNYLAKPTYVLANPQLSQLILDPKTINQAGSYSLPPDHQLTHAGFKPASKSDLEALSSLIGQSPNAQLKGLNELLLHQQGYAASAPNIPIQKQQHVALPEIKYPKQFVLKDAVSQPEAFVAHYKDKIPIKEEVVETVNSHYRTIPKAVSEIHPIKSQAKIDHQIKVIRESKSVYDHDDNLQYAAQYAFGYKIRDFHSGNNFGHEEVREGDVAKGHYHVLLPDGRLQNVDYWADPSGYHATVTYTHAAHH